MSNLLEQKKNMLIRKNEGFKESIFGDFDILKKTTLNLGKNSLLVFGVMTLSIITYKLLSSSSEEVEVDKNTTSDSQIIYVNSPSNESPIYNAILKSITLFLLNIARQKIENYLSQKNSAI